MNWLSLCITSLSEARMGTGMVERVDTHLEVQAVRCRRPSQITPAHLQVQGCIGIRQKLKEAKIKSMRRHQQTLPKNQA